MRITAVEYRAWIGIAMPFFVRNVRRNTAPEAERIRDVPDCADISCGGQAKICTVKTPKERKKEQDCKRDSAQKAQAGLRCCPNL